MNRAALQAICNTRVKEANALLKAGHFDGAYYLIGYAIECALKACVAKQIQRYDFPDKKLANEAFTHDLEKLVRVSGLYQILERDMQASPVLELNWAIVKDWTETSRYELGTSEAQARDMYSACTARKNGILPWIKRRW